MKHFVKHLFIKKYKKIELYKKRYDSIKKIYIQFIYNLYN